MTFEDVKSDKTCKSCKWFCTRNNFCRKNPPTPITITHDDKEYITSKFPVIAKPELDYCSWFEMNIISE